MVNKNHPSRIMKTAWLLLLILALACPSAFADQQGGQRPAAYLQLGAGGFQNAMGGAAVGVRNDVASGFWNPAGLTGVRQFQFETQHTFLSMGQELDYLGVAKTYRDQYSLGVSGILYSAGGDLETRQGPSLSPDSYFDDIEADLFPSFAVRLSPRWSFGGNLKFFIHSMGEFSGFGFGEDLGVQYRFTNHTTFGFVAQDPYSQISYSNNQTVLFPVTLKAGIAHHEEKVNGKIHFDLEWSNDLGFRPRLGLEWRPAEVIALRGGCWMGNLTAGISGGAVTLNPSGGIGLLVFLGGSLYEVAYTLLPDRIITGGLLHQISVTGKFL